MFNLPFLKSKNKRGVKPLVLVIMDGFGLAPPSNGNAITLAKTPNFDRYMHTFPHGDLIASGEAVGLPANEVGNTEVGHLTIGAGRVIFQDLKRINVSIEKGGFYDNKAFLKAAAHAKEYSSKIHLMGLVGSGNVHSSIEHLNALLQFCKKEDLNRVYLHIFTDGRDSPPQDGIEVVKKLVEHMRSIKVGQIATVSGRYYAMDRDRRWPRTEKAYNAIVLGRGVYANSAEEAISNSYKTGKTDEFIEPSVMVYNGAPIATVDDNDAVVFFNFRVDRPKQLAMTFVLGNFENLTTFDFGYDPETSRNVGEVEVGATFKRGKVAKNIFFVTMTEYQKGLPVSAVAFGPEVVNDSLPSVLSENKLKQLHMAESEKERFITYYLNGLREQPLEGEDDMIIPSPKIATYDLKPEMSLPQLVGTLTKEINRNIYSFVAVNFANPDMVAHTGNIAATINAIEFVDRYLGNLVDAILKLNGRLIITADHGNAEELLTFPASTFFYTTSHGNVNTDHSSNPVPVIFIGNGLINKKTAPIKGALSDIGPTILTMLGIPVPSVMTGKNLLL